MYKFQSGAKIKFVRITNSVVVQLAVVILVAVQDVLDKSIWGKIMTWRKLCMVCFA